VQTVVVVEIKVTASADDAVAVTVKGAAPYVLATSAAKEIVCAAFATTKLWLTFGAAA
jgi:hypothetical protein